MKKVLYVIFIILLLAIIAIETPIFLKYYQRENAIEILKKARNYLNYEIIETYERDDKVYSETVKYLSHVAQIKETSVNNVKTDITWSSTNKNISYYIDLEKNTCFPSYDGTLNEKVIVNSTEIENLKNSDLKNLSFRNVDYENKKCLEIAEISENNRVSRTIIDKETGFVLKYYSQDDKITEIKYEIKINELTDEEMQANLENYDVIISRSEPSPTVNEVENDENLPQSIIDDYVSKYSEKNENI